MRFVFFSVSGRNLGLIALRGLLTFHFPVFFSSDGVGVGGEGGGGGVGEEMRLLGQHRGFRV